MKSGKGRIIGKPVKNGVRYILNDTKHDLDIIKFLLNVIHDGKWDDGMGEWKAVIPVENFRGWMMVEFTLASIADYTEALSLYEKAIKFTEEP